MIEIDGELLDLYDQEVSRHSQSAMFSDAVCDSYTTDISIPLTPKNRRILDAFCVIDNPNATYGDRVECNIHTDNTGIPLGGYLYVTEINPHEMVATLYFNNFPAGLYDLKVNRIGDDSSTIVPFTDGYSADPDVGKLRYINKGESLAQQIISPCIRVNTILNKLASQLGIYIPTTANNRRFISSRLVVCPQNTTQVIQGFAYTDSSQMRLVSGQHITNNGHAAWRQDSDPDIAEDYNVTFNRECRAEIVLEGYAGTMLAHLDSSNNLIESISIPSGSTMSTATASWNFHSGEMLRMTKTGSISQLAASIAILEISNYDITEDDYDTPLAIDTFAFSHPYMIDLNGTRNYDNTISFVYIGTICSLPSISIREIINGLCWLDNLRVTFLNGILDFATSDNGEEIDMEIVSMSPQTDKLGKKNLIRWAGDDRDGLTIRIANNTFLPDEVVLHQSPFYGTAEDADTGLAIVPQYQYDGDGNLVFNGEFTDALIMVAYDQSAGGLVPLGQLTSIGLTEISRILFVTATTYDDISKFGYVLHDGHKYIIVDSDTDVATNQTQFTSILV